MFYEFNGTVGIDGCGRFVVGWALKDGPFIKFPNIFSDGSGQIATVVID